MNEIKPFKTSRVKVVIFLAVTLLHITVILGVVFRMGSAAKAEEPEAEVMKLVDVEEFIPPPPPERPPPEIPPVITNNAIAENMIETDEIPPLVSQTYRDENTEPDYVRPYRISAAPVLPEDRIKNAMIYPPIAQRSNIEGIVYLELYIDPDGNIRNINILKEDPPNRGFAGAAMDAFAGIKADKPAEANGAPVAVIYPYVIRFTLK